MILKYVGAEDYLGPNFVARPGDLVEFKDAIAQEKLEKENNLWEVTEVGASRKARGRIRPD